MFKPSHLTDEGANVLAGAIDERVYFIQSKRWIAYPKAVEILGQHLLELVRPFERQTVRQHAAGVDERVIEARGLIEVSVGDYVLSGGEIAALAILDACVRLIPGVMGKEDSGAEESFERGLLEYPHYTRPREWEGRAIPDVLLSGDHAKIAAWRRAEAKRITRERRPDLTER